MQAKFVQEGKSIDYTPVSAVVAGAVVLFGTIPCVATRPIAAGELGAVAIEGVFDIVKDNSNIALGDAIYWDADADPVGGDAGTGGASRTATGNNLMGVALAAAGADATTVRVRLTAAQRTATIAGSVTADDLTGSDSSLGIAGLSAAQGGAVVIAGGTSSTAGNAGGAVTVQGGVPGVTGAGGAVTIAGRAGGATSGAGGAVAIAGGAGTAGNGNGGAVSVLGGNAHGSGTDGTLSLGTSNTSAVSIAAASIATAIGGPITASVGASTAAAGSTNADAGALPAGTGTVYPTTAADDTKGVVINDADKVTGRVLFIGNGVANKILKVYPAAGGTINGAAANAAFSSVSGKGVIAICLSSSSNTWLCF